MINVVAIMGRLTYDPELRTTPTGVSVVRFQVAVDRNFQRAESAAPVKQNLHTGRRSFVYFYI